MWDWNYHPIVPQNGEDGVKTIIVGLIKSKYVHSRPRLGSCTLNDAFEGNLKRL